MKPLVILAHPDLKKSYANKMIKNKLQENAINVNDIFLEYPNYKINVEKEQKLLLDSNPIVLQFPIFWASMPAILKLWIDEVFTETFAFGNKYLLKDKIIFASVTLSDKKSLRNEFNIRRYILYPIRGLAKFCKLKYVKPSILFNMNHNYNKDILIKKAENYSFKLIHKIKTYA